MKIASLLAKIEEDFAGAVAHWKGRMCRWEFVHNDPRGLPAAAIQKLNDLAQTHPELTIAILGESELRAIVMALHLHQLEDLFGAVPSQQTLERLDFEALRLVVSAIQRLEPEADPPLNAPTVLKLERNSLSEDAAGLLRQGRRREKLVETFFDRWPDPRFGEEIAEAFRTRYKALTSAGLTPDQTFGRLQTFAGGMDGEPSHQAAVLAVLSYFFERCDIFEDAVQDAPS